jgi:hypothetical protein
MDAYSVPELIGVGARCGWADAGPSKGGTTTQRLRME